MSFGAKTALLIALFFNLIVNVASTTFTYPISTMKFLYDVLNHLTAKGMEIVLVS